jgi:putative RecB family exonuclease
MEFSPEPQALPDVRDIAVADEHLGLGNDYRPRHLSPSSANLYQQCPRKWRHRYVDRLPDPPGEPALVGTFAHLVLEHLLQLPEGQRSQDAAKELARKHWPEIEQEADYQALQLSGDQAKAFRWKAWEAIAGLWALENPDETEVHATEHEVQVDIAGVPFRGIIDRVDVVKESLVITDYKSGRAPADRFRHRPLKQVLLYAAAVEASFGQRPLGARLLYLGQRTLGTRVTAQNLGAAVDELATTWSSLTRDCEQNEFATSTGPLCAWCPFLAECPDGQQEVISRNEAGSVRADAPGLAIVYANAS